MTDDEMINCAEPGRQITRLRAIMHRLRAPGGCPWDAEQTHESLVSNLIEETYETVAAIRANDKDNLQEELGDLLLQVVFHAELAEEEEPEAISEEVAEACVEKLKGDEAPDLKSIDPILDGKATKFVKCGLL